MMRRMPVEALLSAGHSALFFHTDNPGEKVFILAARLAAERGILGLMRRYVNHSRGRNWLSTLHQRISFDIAILYDETVAAFLQVMTRWFQLFTKIGVRR